MKNFMILVNKLIIPVLFFLLGALILFSNLNPDKPQSVWFMLAGAILVLFSLFWILITLQVLNGKYWFIYAMLITIPSLLLAYRNYATIADELDFKRIEAGRFEVVKQRLIKIREAQIAYKLAKGKYCNSFDELIEFINNGTVPVIKQIGNIDDSVAVAKGLVRIDTSWVPVIGKAYFVTFPVDSLRWVPFAMAGTEFFLDAGDLETGENMTSPVFVAEANYKDFLHDLYKNYSRIVPDSTIRVGSMEQVTTNGSWRE
ncbi:MAG: hypothetical protein IAE67_10550 [Candidatus Competibacteraceae bacterium]|nr:hypothetical protein [Candidatus Competibacteraceae bacterium]